MEAAELKAAEPEEVAHEGPPLEVLIAAEPEPAVAEAEPEEPPEPQPDWRADADAALREQ
jgi:hypothetical protein